MFDAGAIESRLTIRLDQFNRDLTAAENRVRRFTSTPHRVVITAVFDTASIGRARQLFAQLDNQLSRDAANRLRSSPQGSVLGALNALLSPHPVTGSPSVSQSGTQGALGKIVNAPPSTVRPVSVSRNNTFVDNVIGTDDTTVKQKAARAGKVAADAAADAADKETANRRFSLVSRLFSGIGGVFHGGGGGGSGGGGGRGGGGAGSFASNLGGGIGPGILGLSALNATKLGLGAALLGGLPALAGGLAPLGVGGAGLGVLALGAKQLIGTQNKPGQAATEGPLFNQAKAAGNALQSALQTAAGGLAAPLSGLFKQIPVLAKQVTPVLAQVFSSTAGLIQPAVGGLVSIVRQVGPGLAAAFRAAAPSLQPLLVGLGSLVGNIMPGLVALLKAAGPAVSALASVFSILGRDAGTMLKEFAPAISSGAVVLKAIGQVAGALLPIVGKLAGLFASALAPVFVQLASVVKALLPFLTIVGKVLASLAGAVIGDLVSAFGSLAQLLKAIAPSLSIFADAISAVFNILENTGTFAILGDALENIVGPLGKLIDALLRGLVPVIIPVITFVGQLSALLATQLSNAILLLLPPITKLATEVLASLAQILPVLLPLLLRFTGIFTTALVAVIGAVADTLSAVIGAIPPSVLNTIVEAILAIVAAVKLWAIFQAILNVALDANPIGLILLAVVALGVGVFELYKHWSTVWGFIKRISEDAWNFIYNGIGKFLLPLLGPVGLLALGIIEVWQHWKQILGFLVHFVIGDFVQPVTNALLDFIGFMIHGVADAFGWIPGIGGKLKDAARSFDQFKDQVNQSLANIVKNVDVNLSTSGSGSIQISGTGINTRVINTSTGQVRAVGGHTIRDGALITSGAGPRVDDQPAMLAKGELVVPAHMVSAGMVDHLRGMIPGFSRGGLVAAASLARAGGGIANAEAQFGQAAALAFAQSAVKAAKAATSSIAGFPGGLAAPGTSAAAAQAYAASILGLYGWGQSQFPPLVALWNRESGWRWNALNPSSGAYGIPQSLPASKMAAAGADWLTNPATQIRWGLGYIRQVYGTPAGAWAHELANNWYHLGGLVGRTMSRPPGMRAFANGGLITEPVVGYGMDTGTIYTMGERARQGEYEWVGPASGGGGHKIAETVVIQLPEGASVSAAMTELSFLLHTSRMQGLIGAGGSRA